MNKNLPASAGGMGPIPGLGISRAMEQLRPCITTHEPWYPRACAPRKEKPQHEKPTQGN